VYCEQATEVAPTKIMPNERIDYHHRRGEFIRQIQQRPTKELIIITVGANLFAK
jgi:hypothetical protein